FRPQQPIDLFVEADVADHRQFRVEAPYRLLDGAPEPTRVGGTPHPEERGVEDVELGVRQIERRSRRVAQIVEPGVLRNADDRVLKALRAAVLEGDTSAGGIEASQGAMARRF